MPPPPPGASDVVHSASESTPLMLDISDDSSDSNSQRSRSEKEARKWLLTTASLAFAMLVQSYLLVGVFPYSGFLAMHLIPTLTEETAGSYAGLIASSFMIGRTFSSFEWGKVADKYGRTFVIKASLLLSAVFSVLFGLAPTFPLALLTRGILGLCNGLIGPIKTVISELSDGDQSKETNTMAIVMGMWGYGFLLNPAIAGYLSDPVKQYPNSELVQVMGPAFLRANPFLLPNLVGSLFCLLGFVFVHLFVEETLPPDKRQVFRTYTLFPRCCCRSSPTTASNILRSVSSWGLFKHLHLEVKSDENITSANGDDDDDLIQEWSKNGSTGTSIPRWIRPSPSTTALAILSPRSAARKSGRPNNSTEEGEQQSWEVDDDDEKQPATIMSLWRRKSTRQHLMVYWVYSFLVTSVDETFPLYCLSKDSGLAIQEKMIGNLLSGTGLCYVLIQYFLLTSLVDRFGFYTSLRIGAACSIPLVCLIPTSLITNKGAAAGTLTWSTLALLSVIYSISRAFSSVAFSTLTMTTNKTVPKHQRATMNGLSMLGGSLAKSAGPAFAGLLFSTCVGHVPPPFGSVLVYGIIAVLGLGLFVQALLLPEHGDTLSVETKSNVMGFGVSGQQLDSGKNGRDSSDQPPSF